MAEHHAKPTYDYVKEFNKFVEESNLKLSTDDEIACFAVFSNSQDIIAYLKQKGKFEVSENVLICATVARDNEVFEMFKPHLETWKRKTEAFCDDALLNNKVDRVKWLFEKGFPLGSLFYQLTVEFEHKELLTWLILEQNVKPKFQFLCDLCTDFGTRNMLKFLTSDVIRVKCGGR